MENVCSKFLSILKTLPNEKRLEFINEEANLRLKDGSSLLNVSKSQISIPGVSSNFFNKKSPLADGFLEDYRIKNLFTYLASNNFYQRLNHLGFCYSVDSLLEEKEKLVNEIKKTKWHLYEEVSNDETTWLYVGDTSLWENPLVELVLVEKTNDKWKNYWLPHIQIDLDTYLQGEEIEKLIQESFQGKVKPYRLIESNGFIVLVRARLGIVSGINVNLDLGFEGRMTRYHRTRLLAKLI